jgi:hypothetical protein
MRRTFPAVAAVLLAVIGAGAAPTAKWSVAVVPAGIPLFDSASSSARVFADVGAGGPRTLIAVGLPPGNAGYRVDLAKPAAPVELASLGLPAPVQARTIAASRSGAAWMIAQAAQTIVVDPAFAEKRRFEAPRYSPYAGIALAGDKLFGIGGFVEEPYDPKHGSKSEWMRMFARQDCALFYVDLAAPGREPHAVVCDKPYPSMFDRAALGQGFIAASPDEKFVYAIVERNQNLYVIPAGNPQQARTISLLPAGERPYQLTSDDMAHMAMPGSFFELRSRFRSPQGITFGPQGTVAVIFREKGERSHFTADVFTADGRRIAAAVPLNVPEGGVRRYAEVVNLPSGEHYLFVSEPDIAFKKALYQNLFKLQLKGQ